MDRRLHLRVKILHAERRAVETDLAQRDDVFAREPARINLHARLNVVGKFEILVDDRAEFTDFIRLKKRRRTATPMQLDDFAFWIQPRRHLRDFLFEIIQIRQTLRVVFGDDGRAAAKPAECFAERDVKINREVAFRLVVCRNFFCQRWPGEGVRELRCGRITGVTRSGHVVLLHQIQVYF